VLHQVTLSLQASPDSDAKRHKWCSHQDVDYYCNLGSRHSFSSFPSWTFKSLQVIHTSNRIQLIPPFHISIFYGSNLAFDEYVQLLTMFPNEYYHQIQFPGTDQPIKREGDNMPTGYVTFLKQGEPRVGPRPAM